MKYFLGTLILFILSIGSNYGQSEYQLRMEVKTSDLELSDNERFTPKSNTAYKYLPINFVFESDNMPDSMVIRFSNKHEITEWSTCNPEGNTYVPFTDNLVIELKSISESGNILTEQKFNLTPILPDCFDSKWLKQTPPKKWANKEGYEYEVVSRYIEKQAYNRTVTSHSFTSIEGKTLTPKDYNGKVIYVNLFQIGCIGCMLEAPFLDSIQNEFGDKVIFLGLGLQDEKFLTSNSDLVKNFRKKLNGYFVIADPKRKLEYELFGLDSTPATIILDKTGKVRYVHEGYGCAGVPFSNELIMNGCINNNTYQKVRTRLLNLLNE